MNKKHEQEYWDTVSSSFSDGHKQSLWRRHSDQVNGQLLKNWLPNIRIDHLLKTDLFDEAISAGLYPLLARHANRVTGVDISSEAVLAAKSRYPEMQCLEGDLRSLNFDDASFDCIVSNSSLDHFSTRDELHAAISQLFRVLRPGGTLILTLDNPQNPIIWLRGALPFSWINRSGLVPYYVGKSMGHAKLSKTLQSTGFEVADTRAILHCPRVLAVLRAARLERSSPEKQMAFLSSLCRWEQLANWPTRYFTAHYVAALARKPG